MAPVRTLIVDDNEHMRLLGRELAHDAGCTVIGEAASGEEALGKVLEDEPDLVLMDFHMPALNGVDATAQIKAARPETAVVAWTSTDDPGVIERFVAAGAVAHLVKTDLGGLTALLQRLTAD